MKVRSTLAFTSILVLITTPWMIETYVLHDESCNRLSYIPDTKIPHAGTFEIIKEDHTLGNLLRM